MRFFVIILLGLFIPLSVFAQSSTDDDDSLPKLSAREIERWEKRFASSSVRYDGLLEDVRNDMSADPHDFDSLVSSLRLQYSRKADFDPFASATIRDLERYAYVMDTSENIAEVNQAAISYKNLLDSHIVNIDVLDFAIKMAGLSVKYGNKSFLENLRDEVLERIDTEHYDGLSPNRAWKVMTLGEEDYLLAEVGGDVKKSEVYNVGNDYYNVHDIIKEDGSYVQIYIDVSVPIYNIKVLRLLQKKEETLTSLPSVQ